MTDIDQDNTDYIKIMLFLFRLEFNFQRQEKLAHLLHNFEQVYFLVKNTKSAYFFVGVVKCDT
jgi:hypothetical protein